MEYKSLPSFCYGMTGLYTTKFVISLIEAELLGHINEFHLKFRNNLINNYYVISNLLLTNIPHWNIINYILLKN